MQKDVTANNKRIVKNTLILYFRMFFTMAVSLYTSRLVLKALGVEDLGIYNVVGGVVAMMGVVKGVMSGSTARYLNFALGKDDFDLAQKYFNVCLVIYYALSIILFLMAESVGLWFLNSKLVIPENRIFAANCLYQFAVVSAINQLLAAPYNAAIIAHEKMGIFAYISFLEVFLKLLVVFALYITIFDRLIVYGLLVLLCDLAIRSVYRRYCKKHYRECIFHFYKEKSLYKEMLGYSGWNLFGALAGMIKGQGLNVLLNIFFNPSVNASRALSYQINHAANLFVNNFYTAVKPQITKYYAKGCINEMHDLVCRSAKLSFFLFFVLTLPVFIETPFIVNLWLGQLPECVVEFTRLILLISILDCIQQPLKTCAQATGDVKVYEVVIGVITFLNIPVSYCLLKYGNLPPVTVFFVSLILSCCCFMSRLVLLKKMISLSMSRYLSYVLGRGCFVAILASALPFYLHTTLSRTPFNCCMNIGVSVVCSIVAIMFLGMNAFERTTVVEMIKKKLKKKSA